MKGKRIFREKFKWKKRSKLSFLFDDSLFIQGNVSQIDNALISCSSTTKMYLVRIQNIQIVLCVIDRARSRE